MLGRGRHVAYTCEVVATCKAIYIFGIKVEVEADLLLCVCFWIINGGCT